MAQIFKLAKVLTGSNAVYFKKNIILGTKKQIILKINKLHILTGKNRSMRCQMTLKI